MTITIQLLDSNLNLDGIIIVIRISNKSSVDGAKASFSDQEGSAEASSGGFEVGEGEEAKVVGTAVREELVEEKGVGEIL